MTNEEAINVMDKYTDITMSKPVIEAHNMAIEDLKFQDEYRIKVQKCIDRIHERMWIFTEDANPVEIIGMQWANEMNAWCREIVQEEMGCENEIN